MGIFFSKPTHEDKIQELLFLYGHLNEKLNEINERIERIDAKIDVKLYKKTIIGTVVPI